MDGGTDIIEAYTGDGSAEQSWVVPDAGEVEEPAAGAKVTDAVPAGPEGPGGPDEPAQGCTRFHADGSRCTAVTAWADGWCRTPVCGGFRTTEPPAPARHSIALDVPLGARSVAAPVLSAGVAIADKALDRFIANHGGSRAEAEVELRTMPEEFGVLARVSRSDDGVYRLDAYGYRLVLDPEAGTVIDYRSVHIERSYAQFRAGVPGRSSVPEHTDTDAVAIGADVRCRVGDFEKREWLPVELLVASSAVQARLELRPGDPVPGPGDEVDAWVTNRVGEQVTLAVGEFGRRPPTPAAARRLESALRVLDELGGDRAGAVDNVLDAAARLELLWHTARSCVLRNTPSWLHEWELLGRPSVVDLNRLTRLARRAQDAYQTADADSLDAVLDAFEASPWRVSLRWSLARLPAMSLGPEPDRETRPAPIEEPEVVEPVDARAALRSLLTESGEPGTHEGERVDAAVDRRVRRALRYRLLAELTEAGLDPEPGREGCEPPTVICEFVSGRALYAVLGSVDATYERMRAQALRLREAAYAWGEPLDRLVLVLPRAPEQPWAGEAVENVLGVATMWRTDIGWAGHRPDRGTGRDIDADTESHAGSDPDPAQGTDPLRPRPTTAASP